MGLCLCMGCGEGMFIDWFVVLDDIIWLVVDGVFDVWLDGGEFFVFLEGFVFGRFIFFGRFMVGFVGFFKEKLFRGGNVCGSLVLYVSKWLRW